MNSQVVCFENILALVCHISLYFQFNNQSMLLSQELLLAPCGIILTGFESGQQQLDLFPIV